jgi:hypothetical protein
MSHDLSEHGRGLGAACRVALAVTTASTVIFCLSTSPALAEDAAPSVVRNVQFTPIDHGRTTVTWDPPASEGSSPITSYTVIPVDSAGDEDYEHEADPDGSARSAVITGLTDGETYHFNVVATNDYVSSVDSYVDPRVEQMWANQWELDKLAQVMDDLYTANDPAVVAGYGDVEIDPDRNILTFYWKGDVPDSIRAKFAPTMSDMQVKFIPVPYSQKEMSPQVDRIEAALGPDSETALGVWWTGASADFQDGTISVSYCPQVGADGSVTSAVSPQDVQKFLQPYEDTIPVRTIARTGDCRPIATSAVAVPVAKAPVAGGLSLSTHPATDPSGHELISLVAQMSGRPLP